YWKLLRPSELDGRLGLFMRVGGGLIWSSAFPIKRRPIWNRWPRYLYGERRQNRSSRSASSPKSNIPQDRLKSAARRSNGVLSSKLMYEEVIWVVLSVRHEPGSRES